MKLRMRPAVFLNMDEREKAFVIACIDLRIEAEKKAQKKAKKTSKKGGR